MISFIKGTLAEKNPTHIIVEVNGIGFGIFIPFSNFDKIGEIGSEIKIFTHLHVKEDSLTLYGFLYLEELTLFQMLIEVSGIGPRTALGILSGTTVNDFYNLISNKNYISLTAIPGIGKKTAERLVLELYDKVSKNIFKTLPDTKSSGGKFELRSEAVQALCSLGFSRPVAEKSVANILMTNPSQEISLEELIKQALKSAAGN
jgi:Holliday junction DNA helicase RuvA